MAPLGKGGWSLWRMRESHMRGWAGAWKAEDPEYTMSSKSPTTTSSTPPSSVTFSARRTESHDIPDIFHHMNYNTERLFGRINIIYLLEKANLAVTLVNQKNAPVAHAAFLDYPNWDIVDQAAWEAHLEHNYVQNKCMPLNTLFMHLFVTTDEYAVDCCHEIMTTVFKTVPELHFILLFVPCQEDLGINLATAFLPMKSILGSTLDFDYSLYVSHRNQYCPQLYVRCARVEDHDDLTPIFAHHNDTLRQIYGDYFLAELIEAQDEENVAVVCEDDGTAVGFMSVCSKVNIQLLHDCFDLGPFHGLCKPHPDDILKPPRKPSDTGDEIVSVTSQKEVATDTQDADVEQASRVGSIRSQISNASTNVSKNRSIQSKTSERGRTLPSSSLELPETINLDRSRSKDLNAAETLSSLTPETESFRPLYRGAVNAFCIQLFCIDEKHETRSLDFMNFVFNLFPDKDFCIISVPHMAPEFYLIQNFVRIIPFSNCTLDQELYVFHRSGLLKSFLVRAARSSDVSGVELLIQTLKLNKNILDDLNSYILARRDPDGTPIQAFVAEVLHQIVGISVIRNEMDIEYIRSHYNIEDFIYFSHHQQEEHGHLYHFALNPIFHHYAKHFMKEILRLAHKSCLYYPIYPQPEDGKFQNPCAHSLTSALHYMVPVRPRRQIVYPLEKLGINAPSKEVSKDQAKYALNHFNRKLSLEPKVSINARIVVVGASNVGISFLETLVFCPHLKFNNLTLISTHGLPGKEASNSLHKRFLVNSHCFNENDYALMSLGSWINVVVGKMTGIDRSAKHVVVSNGRKVPYDHLVLCTGQQYQVACPTGADIKKLFTNREVSENSNQRYTGIVPSNLFAISDDEDAFIAMKWLKEKVICSTDERERERPAALPFMDKMSSILQTLAGSSARHPSAAFAGNVIVYGNTIDIYTTIAVLLSLGISGSHIHLVHPPSCSNVTSLNNNTIENAVQRALSRAGVTVYRDSLLAQWNDGNHPDPIAFASFTTNTKPFKLQCSAFFTFAQKRVDYETFKAVNDACLVYDGRLVIDTNFHTNDATIRAAGSLTKFSNIYYANEWTHSNFSSKEIGFQLAATMLNLFDPTLEPVFEPPEDMDRLVPIYKGCKIRGGVLPGKYNYVHIFKPGIPSRLDVQESQPNYGMAITTGDAIKGNYFRIHVNQYSMIETITCFSKEPIPVSNYICLFGQHERLLNNLCSRWREGLVTDLYSYLKDPWALPIYHDRFIDLKKELRQILVSVQEDVPSMQELVRQIVEGELALIERPKTYLKRFYKQNVYKRLVEKSILNYLNYNYYHLPMYAWPGIV
ncbi:cilia- and flagella-associated protein 61 isoform X3 [Rhineura floridana]|uniref:cilia- and flagella-associated protein 61 isoform X3 n=1 Tax=Rhineura floridana TaxID=261503 RepID=UPI002AC85DA5|nr:cilia- and flagella-associated protein 61 isoform X3 [Rhineura floridana]